MRLRSTVWLDVCLCVLIGTGAAMNLGAREASAAGDVPVTRSAEALPAFDAAAGLKDDAGVLERARAANEDVYASLQSFVCDEAMNRYRGNLQEQSGRLMDKVSAKLSFERGVEEYSNIRQNNRPRTSLSSLPGAWSEGEFGTLLLQTQQLMKTQDVVFQGYKDVEGEAAAVYRFDVSEADSPWDLAVAGRHYRLAFHTDVSISKQTGEILKIERTTVKLNRETRISEISWGITLNRFNLNGKDWLLPANGTYAVTYSETNHSEWNTINFSGYQRYSSEAKLKFE